jgi:UDP-glucose 4-epimerase
MRILVTGASGLLAPYLIRQLTGEHELVLFSRSRPPEDVVAGHGWVQGDLTSFDDVRRAMEGVDAVQHLGAQSWPTDHPDAPRWGGKKGFWTELPPFDATIRTNVLGPYNVLRSAVQAGVKVVVAAGSNCATGAFFRISRRPWPIHYLPIDEEHPTDVEDTYSFTKLALEELTASYTRAYGLPTYVLRIGYVCDPHARERIRRREREARKWYGGLWVWVSAEDTASAHRMVMEAALAGSAGLPAHDVYFVNADDSMALEPTMELIERFRPELLPLVRRPLEDHASLISTAKLQQAVGWRHELTWRE